MTEYEAVIGLEVHAQLKTRSKLFCACSTSFGQEPNTNVCPVCTGMPGALPVLNKRAVEYAAKMALAVDCQINQDSVFARKNYFYPDLPKGYQISQYESPLAREGRLMLRMEDREQEVRIVRIHMEDDAGKSIHAPSEGLSYVDLNRTGIPLIEIVSGPDLGSADEAVAYLRMLRSILIYLGICDANMEEGNFRCDANVSVRPAGREDMGTRTELKNLNSFRFVHKALSYEIERQVDLLQDGEEVVQETRLFDEARGVTRTMRGKEEAHDYRYFPDPDLVPIKLQQQDLDLWAAQLPELPRDKLERFMQSYGLTLQDSETLIADPGLADYFERAAAEFPFAKTVANWIQTEMLRELKEQEIQVQDCRLAPESLASLLELIRQDQISIKIGKQIFPELFSTGQDPEQYVQDKGLLQISDQDSLQQVVQEVVQEHPQEAQKYKQGKKKLLGFFMGRVMEKTQGQANPQLVNELLRQELE
ncbi:MAG: Asp-tRNA(Asn)/Glu-tRNA(Gln) amidotransferase subunit GatB [Thermodesulfobacteriota bacterium]